MAAETQTCYEGHYVQDFQLYLERSGEHEAIFECFQKVLPEEFKRIAAGKSCLDVLGVGSGGGEMDVKMISQLQSVCPDVSITADIVEGSADLIKKFKVSVAKSATLQKIPFAWHIMTSEEYEKQVQARGDAKKFDFIHMIQMIYYVNDLQQTIKFFHSLLKNNGCIMVVVEAANSGWDILWNTYSKELCVKSISVYRSAKDLVACLKSLGLKYEEHPIPNSFDITDCLDPSSEVGGRLLDFMTDQHHFHQSFTPEVRAGILDLLRNKCSTEKDGRVMFDSTLSCILIHT